MIGLIFLFAFQAQSQAQTPAPVPVSTPNLPAAVSPAGFYSDLENFKNKSLSLQTERAELGAASDAAIAGKLFWTPKLSVSANQRSTELNGRQTSDVNYLDAQANLNVFRAGSDWNTMRSTQAGENAQRLAVINEALRVETKASDLIFKSLYLSEIKRIQEESLKLKEESRKIVADRYAQGKTPLQEITKSEVDLSQQKNNLRLAVLDVLENKTDVGLLFVTELQTKTWPFSEKVSATLSAEHRLPLVEQKYWQSRSLEEAWKAEKGGHWPSLDLSLRYQTAPIKERTDREVIGLATITLPLWSRYETTAQISSAYARYVGAQNDLAETEQAAKLRHEFLKEKIEVARVNLIDAKKNLERSKKLYQDILRSFRLGRISTNDLFLEQNRLLQSETSLALNQLNFHQALIEACALSGTKASDCLK